MSSIINHQSFKKSQFRPRKRTINHKRKQSTSINHSQQFLFDLPKLNTRFLSYTITELELICQQIAIQEMSASARSITTCPWICLFCENLIYEPMTLYCGHTYCEQCIKDEELSLTSLNCPRCSVDIQEQIQSPILYAREKCCSKNHFLKEIVERSETLKTRCENILLCHQAQNHYANKNYQQAINIYSQILEKCKIKFFLKILYCMCSFLLKIMMSILHYMVELRHIYL